MSAALVASQVIYRYHDGVLTLGQSPYWMLVLVVLVKLVKS